MTFIIDNPVDLPGSQHTTAVAGEPCIMTDHSQVSKELGKQATSAENQYGLTYRNYDQGPQLVRPCVSENYRTNHTFQTYDFVCRMHEEYSRFDKAVMGVWEAVELLNEVVDDSDPDTALPQIEHLLQTAEAARAAYPEEDWLHLTGLIHDLGKVLAHPRFGSQPQWAVVGDTFPTGCAHDPAVVFHDFFTANPDSRDPVLSTRCGVYQEGCGLDQVKMSWGHDEYLYMVLKHNGCTLPPPALFIIRYHSFYALHQAAAYGHLLDASDRVLLPWLQCFQKCDLYSKTAECRDEGALKPYYMGLIRKYFPKSELQW